jgi:hypothetical protein
MSNSAANAMPAFNVAILRKPETIKTQLEVLRTNFPQFTDIADIVAMCLGSSATNDYLEKIGAEAIGARHLDAKLGGDGELHGRNIEVKPTKGSPGVINMGVINDDTPMKLLDTHTTYSYIVFINATKDGSRINYALCAPYAYWENSRYQEILKKLDLKEETGWTWGNTLPTVEAERVRCLNALVEKHKKGVYVRSSSLSLNVLATIPKRYIVFWKHPDVEKAKLHKILRDFC